MKGFFAGNDGGVGVLAGPLLWSTGLDYLSKDNKSVGFDDPRAAAALAKLRVLNTNNSLLLGAPSDWSDPAAFIDELAAMQWIGLWNIPKIQAALKDDFGVLLFPKLDASGAPSVPVGAYGAMINAKSANVAAAKDYLKWLWVDKTDYQLEFATKFGFHVPARQSLVGGPVWTAQSNTALSDAVAKIAKEGADPAAETRKAVYVAKAELKRLFG